MFTKKWFFFQFLVRLPALVNQMAITKCRRSIVLRHLSLFISNLDATKSFWFTNTVPENPDPFFNVKIEANHRQHSGAMTKSRPSIKSPPVPKVSPIEVSHKKSKSTHSESIPVGEFKSQIDFIVFLIMKASTECMEFWNKMVYHCKMPNLYSKCIGSVSIDLFYRLFWVYLYPKYSHSKM